MVSINEGILSYPQHEDVEYSIEIVDNPDNIDILKTVSFKSRDTYINGFLRIPDSSTEVAGIVLLSGAGETKSIDTITDTKHGFTFSMRSYLEQELALIFN